MTRLFAALLLLTTARPLLAGQGGPDDFGYIWMDCDEPGGPSYAWTEIRKLGNPLNFGDDQSLAVALPWPFRFYGIRYYSVYICSNGFLSFDSDNSSPYPEALPNPNPPNAMAAPLWNDLNPSDPSSGCIYYYHDTQSGRLIVEWDSLVHFGTQNYYSFQAVLDPADSSLIFLYRSAHPGWQADAASTGIEDHAGVTGLGVAGGLLRDQYAVKFFCPPDTHDLKAARIQSPAWHLAPQAWTVPELLVCNLGLVGESFPAVCLISSGGQQVYSDTFLVSDLAPGDSAMAAFRPWLAGPIGQRYSVVMFCDHKDDQNPRNDTLRLEAVSFDYRDKITSAWRQGPINIDGVISPGEWPVEGRIDISDVLGKCGTVQAPGAAWLYAQNDLTYIYLALDACADPFIEDGDAWTMHVDDDGSGAWNTDGSEGRYRLVKQSVESFEFAPLPGGLPGPVTGGLWSSSAANGRLQRELAIPLGTLQPWQLGLAPGQWCLAQVSAEDGGSGAVFGWWPQNLEAEHEEIPQGYGRLLLAEASSGVAAGSGQIWLRTAGLVENKPNPFSGRTTIRFGLPEASAVTLKVYNVAGQGVRTLVQARLQAGEHQVLWDGRTDCGSRAAAGVYVCRMSSGNGGRWRSSLRMLLVD